MSCAVLGPGLVGTYLGAACAAPLAIGRIPGGNIDALVALPDGVRRWTVPNGVLADGGELPVLLATRCHQSPWVPLGSIAAQNGIGQTIPVVVCFMAIDRTADGVVRAVGPRPRLVLADPGQQWAAVVQAWQSRGLQVEVVPDVRPAQWEKTIFNATVGPLCRARRVSMAALWADAAARQLVMTATLEGIAVARAAGVALDERVLIRAEEFFSGVGAHTPSVIADAGELPWVLGALGHAAHQAAVENLAVATPALAAIAREVGTAFYPKKRS